MNYWNPCGPKVHRGPFSFSMRILIAGGLGFVGGRLAVRLAHAGHRVVLGSRNAAAPPAWLSQAEVVKIDWEDAAALKRCCIDVDMVIQAAGMNAQDCATDPVAALTFNGVATARLVAAASGAGVRRIIYLSTAHVYASRLVGTITEESCPRNLHPYATSHLAGEQAVLGASQRGNIQGIVLRLSNAFGAPMNRNVNCWMLLVNDLCKQAVETHKLILHSGGHQQRDFIAMNEVCRAVERFVVANGDSCPAGIFNIGIGSSQSVLSIAQTIQQRCVQVLGFKPELQRKQDVKEDSFMPFTYDTSRLALLGAPLDSSNNIEEIDHLLRYCATTFNQIKRYDA